MGIIQAAIPFFFLFIFLELMALLMMRRQVFLTVCKYSE